MPISIPLPTRRAAAWLIAAATAAGCAGAAAQPAAPAGASLRERYAAARDAATQDLFQRPLYLQSTAFDDRMQGDVYSQLEVGFPLLRQALQRGEPWCGILILHLNVQYCRASGAAGSEVLDVAIGRKFDQPLAELYWLRFVLTVARADEGQVQVALQSPGGPLGTRDYRIAVEAEPAAAPGTGALLHLRYGYAYGLAARWAMQAYLATIGSDKVGFTVIGQQPDGQPQRVGGVRGVLERNTLRYQLAIESYLGAQARPPAERLAWSLNDWFSATERHPQQLHELDRAAYVTMKLGQVQRQQTQAPPR